MLAELHAIFPKNMAVQNLGSLDRKQSLAFYRQIGQLPANDFAQVHRYLDTGAAWDVCHGPMDVLAADAVRQLAAFNLAKPILLAECGAVEPRYAGPFRLYEKDHEGVLLHDLMFAPFFAGSAGCGQSWHWYFYVDKHDLWHHFGPLSHPIRRSLIHSFTLLDSVPSADITFSITHQRRHVMTTERHITRRRMLRGAMAGASGVIAGTILEGREHGTRLLAGTGAADPKIRGPFPILTTPFTASGALDFDALANQTRFVDWGGCPGMIWPQSGDSIDLLTTDEKLQGMEVLAKTARGLRTVLCLGVQGKDTADMLIFAKHAEKLAPAAIISRPPDSGTTEDDMRRYWRALASVTKRPVILQTTGGVAYKGPSPSLQLLIELAKEFPNFGYVKEEANPVIARTRALLAARPPIRRVFSARGGLGWLYESRLGTEGLITERAVYADVLTRIWELQQSGSDPAALRDAYSKFILMTNLSNTHPGGLRGPQLYLWKKRGVFRTMVSRHYGPGRTIPASPIFSELTLTKEDIAEIEYRFEGLKPYLKPGSPSFAPPLQRDGS